MLDVLIPPTEEDLKIKEAIRAELMSITGNLKVDDNTFVIKNVVISMTGNTFIVVKDESKICMECHLWCVDVSNVKKYIQSLIR